MECAGPSAAGAGTGDEEDESAEEAETVWEAVRGSTPSEVSHGTITVSDGTSQTANTTPDPTHEQEPCSRSLDDRTLRKTLHHAHTLALFASLRHRNALINDALLHARLLSLVPLHLHDAVRTSGTHRSGSTERSEAFEAALQSLNAWWNATFDLDARIAGLDHRSIDELTRSLAAPLRGECLTPDDLFARFCEEGRLHHGEVSVDSKAKGKSRANPTAEILRDAKSLHKRALSRTGSADMSVLLFAALCRALHLQVRLVANLQPVSIHASAIAAKSTPGKSGISSSFTESVKRTSPAASPSRARKRRRVVSVAPPPPPTTTTTEDAPSSSGQVERLAAGTSESWGSSAAQAIDIDFASDGNEVDRADQKVPRKVARKRPKREPGCLWLEVWSKPASRWMSVDVVRKRLHCETIMEPKGGHMLYVVAYEQDGQARDVTLRYAVDWYSQGWRQRPPELRNNSGWWPELLESTSRPYKLPRDRAEDEELRRFDEQRLAVFPTILSDFKDHPRYIIERFLKRDEACYPHQPVGLLWNKTEHVFLRSSICKVANAFDWQRHGRTVLKAHLDRPVKRILPRAGRGPEDLLYAQAQTELSSNPPVAADGTVSSDMQGCIHILQPHMMPEGGSHLTFKGAAEFAKQHNVPFAQAVVSLSNRKGKIVPTIDGIVVATQHAKSLQQMHDEAASLEHQRQRDKLISDRWRLLLRKLAIRQRFAETDSVQPATSNADDVEEFDM